MEVGDVMRTPQEAADGFTDGMTVVVYIDDEYYHCTNALIAIKNQDDYEYPPMNRRQKTAWSEDDNELIDSVIELIDSGALDRSEKDYFIENLNSLKDRYTWKPSDEQMKQLGWVAKQNKDNMIGKELMSLYQDLKKLKDE